MLGSTAISPFSQKDTVGSSEQRLSIAGMWGRRSISQPSRQKWCLFFGLWEPLSQIAMPYPEKARRRHRIFTAAQIYTDIYSKKMQGIRDWHRLAILLQHVAAKSPGNKANVCWILRCRGLQSPVRRPCPARPAAPMGPGRAGYGVLKGGWDQWVWMILGWWFFGWFSGWFLNDI